MPIWTKSIAAHAEEDAVEDCRAGAYLRGHGDLLSRDPGGLCFRLATPRRVDVPSLPFLFGI